jgi:hypothetical protein
MNKALLVSSIIFSLSIFDSYAAQAQSMTPLVNGFSIGRSNGISSNFTQITRSESNVLIDIVKKNVVGNSTGLDRIIPDSSYKVIDNDQSFSIVQNKNTNNSGSSETIRQNSAFTGFNHSIFSD